MSGSSVLYHRVSTVDQDPTAARAVLRRASKLRGFQIIAEIEETGSGARNDRPGLRRVLELASRGQVTHVLVWKLDRFGRSALDLLSNLQQLRRCGVTFVAVDQALELGPKGDSLGELLFTLLAAVAEFERNLIRERTQLGVRKRMAAGLPVGRPVLDGSPDGGRVAAYRARGWSWRRIAGKVGACQSSVRRAFERHERAGEESKAPAAIAVKVKMPWDVPKKKARAK